MRILVVEDENKVARFVQRGLKENRHCVEIAGDGEEGLHRGLEFEFDLIVLDVLLPGKDGFLREKVDRGFETKLIHTVRGAGYGLKSKI